METKLFSELERGSQEYEHAINYLIRHIRNPSPQSQFEVRTRGLREPSDEQLVEALKSQGYDALIGKLEGEIVGHIAYQEGGSEGEVCWNVFSTFVEPEYRGRCLSVQLAKRLAEYARKRGVNLIKVGDGDNLVRERLLKKLLENGKINAEFDLENHLVRLLPS
ncbi:MAG: GNAT family N-acetyltransferase [Nanoarchaeota archaeon]